MRDLDILWEDEDILVLNKPAGILVHRSAATSQSETSLLQIARRHSPVFPIHRLDRPTSGVLLLAKSSAVAQQLGKQFQERLVEKTYLAVVRGWLVEERRIQHPLDDEERGLQEAESIFTPLAQVEFPIAVDRYPQSRYSLIQAKPLSGRRHQLRRHLKHMHHPIIGDSIYGHGAHNRLFRENFACPRLLLHHRRLGFQHPQGQNIEIVAPLDAEFLSIMQRCAFVL